MNTVLEWLKKPFVILGLIISALLLALKFLSGKNKQLEADAENAESNKKDAVLAQEQKDNKANLDKDLANLEKEKAKKLSDQELLDELEKL